MTLLIALAGALLPIAIALIITGARRTPEPQPGPAPTRASRRTRLTPRTRLTLALSAGAGILFAALTGWLIAIVLFPAAALGLPRLLSAPNARAQIERLDAMQDWTRALAGAMAVGLGLEAAIKQTLRSTPAPIRPEVEMLIRRLNTYRTDEALRAFADDLNDPTGDLLAANLIQANSMTGVPLSDVLADVADSIAADVRGRRDVEADRAKPRAAARLITVISILTIGGLLLTPYTQPFRTPLGQAVLAIEVTLFTLALVWLRRMAVIPESPRFLTTTTLPAGAPR